jgi:hypothetical protein
MMMDGWDHPAPMWAEFSLGGRKECRPRPRLRPGRDSVQPGPPFRQSWAGRLRPSRAWAGSAGWAAGEKEGLRAKIEEKGEIFNFFFRSNIYMNSMNI